MQVPQPIPFDPHRFQGAAADYLPGRAPYAAALVPRVAQLLGLSASHRVMDLGCGPAQLARAFAPLCAEVLAIDPEPEMLRVAEAASADAPGRIRFRQGSSYDLAPDLAQDGGRFQLAAIGRAFHWMDRPDTLARLDALLDPGGAVVLFSTRTPELPENGWHAAFEAVLTRYEAEGSVRAARRGPAWVPHETVLLDSPFCHLAGVSFIERRSTPAAVLTRRALSMSSTSRARVGERLGALETELQAALAPFVRDGVVSEVVESVALMATR
jgi:SAM-dependent methyltransferase